MRKIEVIDYQTTWPILYAEEEYQIQSICGDILINSFHIGSTSVPNLAAKPVIDILLVVNNLTALDQLTPAFETLGYEVMGEFGIPQRRYFRKGGAKRTHHIHAFQTENTNDILRHLAFAAYLREHPRVAAKYSQLKKSLAQKYVTDLSQYGNGKAELIAELESAALTWYWQTLGK